MQVESRNDPRRELAHFLVSRRARLAPDDVGLSERGRRRVPGLRREEVAVLANVSETWYARLEQGRPINASRDVLAAIATALRLDGDEREYLFALAGRVDSGAVPGGAHPVPPSVGAMLDALTEIPAVVYGPQWDILMQNRAYVAVFGDIAEVPVARGNVVRQMFLDRSRRTLLADWENVARVLLQNVRAGAARNPGDPALTELASALCAESDEFQTWWNEHDVVRRMIGKKRVRHPSAGMLVFEHAALALPEIPGVMIVVYTPVAGTETATELRRLAAADRSAARATPG